MDGNRSITRTDGNELHDPCYVNAMSHFYRGELGRIMVWRQRLDITTTWAITSTTTIITVAFSFRDIPHIIFFFNLVIVWMMLWIEARRYRFYDAFRGRVRMIESHFLVATVSRNPNLLGGDWQKLVCEDLILPSFKISKLEAVGRRLKRNYVFIIATRIQNNQNSRSSLSVLSYLVMLFGSIILCLRKDLAHEVATPLTDDTLAIDIH